MGDLVTIVSDTHELLEDTVQELPVIPEHTTIIMGANRGGGRPVTAHFDPDYTLVKTYRTNEGLFVPDFEDVEDIRTGRRLPSRIKFRDVVPHQASQSLPLFTDKYLEQLLKWNYGIEEANLYFSGSYSDMLSGEGRTGQYSVARLSSDDGYNVEIELNDPHFNGARREKVLRFARDLRAKYVERVEQISLV